MSYLLGKISQVLTCADFSKLTIEHIYPQSLINEGNEEMITSIGNLTLLNKNQNSSAKDKSFSDKLKIYAESECPLTKSLVKKLSTGTKNSVQEKFVRIFNYDPPQNQTWGKEEIDKRRECLIQLAESIWFDSLNQQ